VSLRGAKVFLIETVSRKRADSCQDGRDAMARRRACVVRVLRRVGRPPGSVRSTAVVTLLFERFRKCRAICRVPGKMA
jgi:hypothetical protein